MAPGPIITTISAGNRKKISGNKSLSAIFPATSSARNRRFVRSISECTRKETAILVPKRSACISIETIEGVKTVTVLGAHQAIQKNTAIDGKFPAYKVILPNLDTLELVATINCEYLAAIQKALLPDKNKTVIALYRDPNGAENNAMVLLPCSIDNVDENTAIGLVMPARI